MSIVVLLTHLTFALLLGLVSWGITWWMLQRVRIMDVPNARSSHERPTPRGGGVSIVLTFVIGIIGIFLFADQAYIEDQYFLAFLISAIVMSLISFYDDIKNYPFHIKLITHLFAIFIVLISGLVIDAMAIPFIGVVELGWVGYVLTFIWLLGLSNAYNFMDGIDGLAASTAVIVCAFFGWITFHEGSHFIYIVSYTIVAGAGGFLFWNRPPARIFMGDIGSVFLGFVLASMAIIADRYDMSHTSILVMPLLLLHFIFDTAFTMGRRALAGENITQAHRSHLYQLLVRIGMSHRRVTCLYATFAISQGAAAVLMVNAAGEVRLLIFIPFLLVYSALTYMLVVEAKARNLL